MMAADEMPAHPAADLFPMLDDDDLQALAEDIAAHGLRQPIIVHDGQVLDGRNRLAACQLAGVEPVTVTFDGDDMAAIEPDPEDQVSIGKLRMVYAYLAMGELAHMLRQTTHALEDASAERDRYKAAIDAILAGAPDPVSVCERAVRGRL